ncbi:MAG TPA: histidinol-phosphate transaminase [Salinisphaeraceae bacterium]|nr:histidinol-phosphate transaminase [Salinisphaeraceae bacterium]
MTSKLIDQAHAGIVALHAYEPGKPIAELQRELGLDAITKLASNENPLGMAPAAREVLAHWNGDLSRYPDGNALLLKQELAQRHDIGIERITLGNGSSDVLELVARVFLGPGRNALLSAYSFALYPTVALGVNAEPREVPALAPASAMPYGHDLDAFAAHMDAHTSVLFLASPNNPTGTWLEQAAFEALLAATPEHVLVVLDEAYVEYQDPAQRIDSRALLERYPNLVVMRTFSKIFGMAGLRVGYALSSPAVADLLNRIRAPFNVNELAQQCAVAAVRDTDFVARSQAGNAAERAALHEALQQRGLRCLPSQGNFITFDCAQPSKPLFEALLHHGVIVRALAGYGLPQHLRVTVGTAQENRIFLTALDQVLAAA